MEGKVALMIMLMMRRLQFTSNCMHLLYGMHLCVPDQEGRAQLASLFHGTCGAAQII